ncbi:MAG: hypothetical protein AAFQ94_18990 [Bacteroidota bacterium]
MRKRVSYVIYCFLVVVPLLEGLLWVTGYRPYRYEQFSIVSIPTQNIVADSVYGLALNPGSYKITINDGLTYQATHSSRFSRKLVADTASMKENLAVFGCSYTYGMGVNDEDAFPAQLQSQNRDLRISSYAIPGFGTVQGFIQLQQLVSAGEKPDIALFNFADFHIDRNAMTPAYRLHLNIGYQLALKNQKASMSTARFPYVYVKDRTLHYRSEKWPDLYKHWRGRETFALVNLLQTIADRYKTASIDAALISETLFAEIQRFCDVHDIRLVVAGITKSAATSAMLQALNKHQIETVDISLPLKEKIYNNLPFDSHPNKEAHRLLAEKMNDYLSLKNKISNR